MVDHIVNAVEDPSAVRTQPGEPRASLNIREFLDEPEPERNYVIDGVLERGERLILTGGEGKGKSSLIRQLGVQAAAGIHPFTLMTMEPVRVLLIDLENPRRHLKTQLRSLYVKAGADLEPDAFHVESAPAGIDLLLAVWRAWLLDRVVANAPDLLLIGPLYKLAFGDPCSEEVARVVAFGLDDVRAKHDLAIVLEAHSPYSSSGGKRPQRPYGASLWSRWPEFGIHLGDDGALSHWRGPRDERDWPAMLKRGGEWPWTVESNQRQVTFARIVDLTRERGKRLSLRELEQTLNVPKSTIDRAVAANQRVYDELVAEMSEVGL